MRSSHFIFMLNNANVLCCEGNILYNVYITYCRLKFYEFIFEGFSLHKYKS